MHVRLIYSESLHKYRPPTLSPVFHLQTGWKEQGEKVSRRFKKKQSIVVSLWRCYMKIKPRRNFFKTICKKKKSDACWKILNSFVSDFVAVIPNTSENNHWVAYFLFFFPFTAGTAEKNKATLTLELQKPSDWTLALNVKSSMSQTEWL